MRAATKARMMTEKNDQDHGPCAHRGAIGTCSGLIVGDAEAIIVSGAWSAMTNLDIPVSLALQSRVQNVSMVSVVSS